MLVSRAWALAIVALLIIPVFVLEMDPVAEGSNDTVDPPVSVFSGFSPFRIENDTSLMDNVLINGWLGSGTGLDPFLIKDLTIDANQTEYAAMIANTSFYVNFENCTFWNTSNQNREEISGLRILNSSNILVNGCHFNNSRSGIYTYDSEIIVRNSTFISNYLNGILSYSSSVQILNSTFIDNFYGAYLRYCEAPMFDLNNITENNYGADLGNCPNSTFKNNIFDGHIQYGIYLSSGSNNGYFLKNTYLSNGVGAWINDKCIIINDTYIGNGEGIRIWGDDVIINSCTITGGTTGIFSNGYFSRGRIDNSTIRDCDNGIDLFRCDHFEIKNNTLQNCDLYGIDLWFYNNYAFIENNTIIDSTNGMRLRNDQYCTIKNNRIGNCITGAYLYDIDYSEITGNTIINCTENGIHLLNSMDVLIAENELNGNSMAGLSIESSFYLDINRNTIGSSHSGIEYEFSDYGIIDLNSISNCVLGITSRGCDRGTFENNTILDCSSYGFTLSESNSNYVINNTIMKSKFFGLNLISSSDNTLFDNALAYNNKARIEYNSSARQAQDNFDSNQWFKNGKGNYWRDLTSPDTDQNGIVDVPYQINGMMNRDPYPLTTTEFLLVPSAVLNLSAVPFNGRVDLYWEKILSDGGSPLTGFNIYRKNSTSKYQLFQELEPHFTFFSDIEVVNKESYSYKIAAVNIVGDGPFSDRASATPDDTEPVIEIRTPSSGAFINSKTVYFSWKGTDEMDNIIQYLIKWDESEWSWKGLVKEYYVEYETNGPHNFTVAAIDEAGNMNSSTIDFIIDTELPRLTILKIQEGGWINTTSAYFEWTMDDTFSGIDHIDIRWDDVYWLDKDLSTNITIKNLGEGPHIAYFNLVDRAGNEIMKTINFSIDLQDPEVWFEYPENGAMTNTSSLWIRWVGLDHESDTRTFMIKVDGGQWEDIGVVYNATVDLGEDGDHRIYLKLIDNAGNQAVTTLDISLDRENPQIISYGPIDEGIDPENAEIFIQFTEYLDLNNIDISVNGKLGTVIWSVDNVMFFTPSEELRYGTTYEVSISGKDLSGNSLIPFSWTFSTDDRGYLKGRILDFSNFPVKNAVITVLDDNTSGTDGAGNFEMTVVSGQKTITIEAPGYLPYSKDIMVIAGETYDLGPIRLEEKIDMGTIKGKIVDDDGDPILGVIITLDTGETVTTSEDGLFEFNVEIGNYTISFVRDGFDRHVETAWVKKDKVLEMEDIELTPSGSSQQTTEGGLELWQMQLLVFLVIVILGIIGIYIIMRRSRAGMERLEEE